MRKLACYYTIHAERAWLYFKIKKRVLHASVTVFILSRLIGFGYSFKLKPQSIDKRADNYAIHAERDWLFF